jgi:lysozyme
MAIHGIDVSKWQGNIDWTKVKKDFAILKCTQGEKFIDAKFKQNKEEARKNNIPLGYYHFSNGDNAIKEAQCFIRNVGDIAQGEFLVLDFEIKLQNPVTWCLDWLKEAERLVGFKPLIYLNSSTAKIYNWQPIIDRDTGLWIANYGLNLPVVGLKPPAIGKWPFYAIWQYSSRGKVAGINGYVDLNYCKFGIDVLEKYGKA